MKKTVRYVLAAALALCVAAGCVLTGHGASEEDASVFSHLSFVLELNGAREPIACFAQDDAHGVVFLPSCAQMDKLTAHPDAQVDVTLDGIALTDGTPCDAFRVGADYALTVGNETASLRFMQAENVAALFVHPESGSMEVVHTQKKTKEPARLLLVTADGGVAYQSAGSDDIRGRGNSTWGMAKKPYNLYLRSPADLLGMGEATEWVLLANAYDETNLRNRVICDFAKRVTGDPRFAPDTAFADVYLEGEYAGLYLLCEKTQVAENRLDISPDSVLFSWVQTGRNDSFFALNAKSSVEIEYPKDCSDETEYALEVYLRAMQKALNAGRDWQRYIDLDSFAYKYLIEEVFSNYDLYNSQYFYREANGKLFAGPCWDYDLTLGIKWRNKWNTPCAFTAQNKPNEYETWYSDLWKQEAFRERVKTLFRTKFLPLLDALADGGIERQARGIAASAEMNTLRWTVLFGERTYADAVDDMTQYLTRRIAFLRSAWVDGTEYCTLTLQHPVAYEYISVLPGTVCTEFPDPQGLELPENTVWLRADTLEPFDPQSVITEDVTLTLPQVRTISRHTIAAVAAIAAMAGLTGAAILYEFIRRKRRRRRS